MYRCEACGNKTRFDIFEAKRVRAFHHFTLAGDDNIEEEEVLDRQIEKIVCRWCGSSDAITEEPVLEDQTAGEGQTPVVSE